MTLPLRKGLYSVYRSKTRADEERKSKMYSIGMFSRINQVTPKTLRHYARMGLLKPAYVDTETGYRYYDATQIVRMRQILTSFSGFCKNIINSWASIGNAASIVSLSHSWNSRWTVPNALIRTGTSVTEI